MKKIILTFLFLTAVTLCAALPPRVVRVSGPVQKIRNLEIVVENPTPLLNFAAKELQTILKKGAGVTIPVVKRPSGKKTALILGDSSFARAAGIDVKKLPDEGYYIRRKGNSLFLAGKDDPRQSPRGNLWQQVYKRGTLSAVYDFLERFADVRFFFSGPYGTVIPSKGALHLPAKIEIMERPDMSHRSYYHGNTIEYPGYNSGKLRGDTLTRIRLRFSEELIPYGHGLCFLDLIKRFGKTHPEYFALMPDGRRCMEPDIPHTGHLCYNSGIREELYQDAKAFLLKKPASTRGLKRWSGRNGRKGFFNIMPQDWLYWCGCSKCSKLAEGGRGKVYSDPVQRQRAGDFLWEFTCEVARRLKKEGIKGGVAQMAYAPYDKVPKCDIPDNVRIQVAIGGAMGNKAEDTAKLKAWFDKSGQRLTVWTYGIGKHMSKKIPGIPPMLHRHIGAFIDANKKYIDGGFFESETDVWIFQYLNYYIIAKKLWNNSLDTEKLLDDHCRSMFGKGAPMMKKFYDSLEEMWGKKILGNTVETGLGPVTRVPTDFQLWTEIFSPARMKYYNGLFNSALRAAARDKEAVGRIKFIRKHLFGHLEKAAANFASQQSAKDSWRIYLNKSVYLRPYNGEVSEVATKVTASRDAKNLIITFDCAEPRMKDMIVTKTKRDDPMIFADSDIEILLNPSGDLKNYYQFVVNPNGALADYRCKVNQKADIKWNSGAAAKAVRRADGWSATVTIPLKSLGKIDPAGFPINFCRNRALKGAKVKEIYYQWSPMSGKRGGFHAINNWGKLSFKSAPRIFYHEDFSGTKQPRVWLSGGKKGGQVWKYDDKVFITGGRSLYFKNVNGLRISAGFDLPGMKPDTKYRMTYFLKTKGLKGRQGAGAFIYFNNKIGRAYPNPQILGTTSWHRLSFVFKTPGTTGKGRTPILGLWIWLAGGEAWFDDVRIEEIK